MDVAAFLGLVRARLRRVVALDALALVIACAIAAIIVAVGIDWWFRTPGPVRLLLLAGVVGGPATILYQRLLRPLSRRLEDRDLALLVERRLPELNGRLISQVEGIATGDDLTTVLTHRSLAGLVPARNLPWRLAWAGLAMATSAVLAWSLPGYLRDGLTRLLLPLGAHEWTRTSAMESRVDRQVVAADEPVVVAISRRFGSDAPVRLSWQMANRPQREQRQLSGLAGPWRQTLSLVPGTWNLRVESGDALPEQLSVRVVPRPRLERLSATLTPPAYTKLPPLSLSTLDCTALPGSRLQFTAQVALASEQQLAQAVLRLGDTDLPSTHDERSVSATCAITVGGQLTLALADADGIAAEPTPRFTLTLAEDRRPVVSVSGPRAKESVTTRAQVQITVEGSDDYGLAELALTAQTLAQGALPDPALRKDLVVFPEVSGLTTTTRRTTIDLAKLAAPGSRVVLIGRAKDANDVTGPGTADSQAIELTIVDEDALRQDLDRQLAEARDRTAQTREEIIAGLASNERLSAAARGAALSATRANDTLSTIVRRWRDNQLPEDQLKPIVEATTLVANARPQLDAAQIPGDAAKADSAGRTAETALGKAERLLSGLLSDSDLTRRLAIIVERQRALNADSRAFVVEHLTKTPDAAGKTRQSSLGARQQELAGQVKEAERVIQAGGTAMAEAQQLIRSGTPAEHLVTAASQLIGNQQRTNAIDQQTAALDVLVKLLDALRGSDAAADLAQRAGELAKRQETLAKRLELGAPPGTLAEDQRQLMEDTTRFAAQVAKRPDAAQQVTAATKAQSQAKQAMSAGDRQTAQREADTAASLLRDAQHRIDGSDQKKDEPKKDDKPKQNLIAVLRRLHSEQSAVVASATTIHSTLGDKPLDFRSQRTISDLARREQTIHQTLRDEVIAKLDKQPIARVGIERVAAALDRSATHLATPALGERGLRLTKIALTELARLLAIVEQQPPPKSGEPSKGGGGENGGNSPPFPPQAELSLLAAMQDEVARLTVTNAQGDVTAAQRQIAQLVDGLKATTRPGTRPEILLNRTTAAALSATDLLSRADRGLVTRHQQEAAGVALRQLIAESAGSSGGGDGDGQPPPPQQGRNGSPPPSDPGQSQASGNNSGEGQAASDGKQSGKQGGRPNQGVLIQREKGDLLQLPPELRERLRQIREQPMPPGALPVYERYLELLEQGK